MSNNSGKSRAGISVIRNRIVICNQMVIALLTTQPWSLYLSVRYIQPLTVESKLR